MLHRSIKIAYVAVTVLVGIMAFAGMYRLDDYHVMGSGAASGYRVWVQQSTPETSDGAQAADRVDQYATAHRLNIARYLPDVKAPGSVRHLYLAVGDPTAPTASWPSQGYPAFNTDLRTRVHPVTEARSLDPRGFYLVFGSRQAAEGLRAELAVRGEVDPILTPRALAAEVSDDYLVWCLILTLLVTVSMVGLGVLLSARAYGVQSLQGRSYREILLRDLTLLSRFLARTAPVAMAVWAGALFFYNRCQQIAYFALGALMLAAFFVAVGLVTHAMALALTMRVSVLGSVKGELPSGPVTFIAYALRLGTAVLATTVLVGAVGTWQLLDRQDAVRSVWDRAGDTVRITLNGSVGDELETELRTVGQWLRREDANGGLILADRRHLYEMPWPGDASPYGEILIVNQAYLSRQRVLSAAGQALASSPGERRVRLLVPPSQAPRREQLMEMTREWVAFMASQSRSGVPPTVAVDIQGDQSLFSYGSGSVTIGDPSLRDSAVIVLPSGANLLSGTEYASAATRASVVFPNRAAVDRERADPRMATYVNGVETIAQRAAEERAARARVLRFEIIDLLSAVAVLLVTAIGTGMIFCRKNAQLVFARYISGWSFPRTYRAILLAELALAALTVAWVVNDTLGGLALRSAGVTPATKMPSIEKAGAVTGWEPAMAVAMAGVGFALLLTVLAVFNSAIVRERAAGA